MKALRLLIGMIAGNVVGGLLCLIATMLAGQFQNYIAVIVYPNLIIIPFAIGLIAVLVGITYGILPYGGHTMGWTAPGVIGTIAGGLAVWWPSW